MRALVQRATRASVTVEGETIGAINDGFLILLGVGHEDTEAQADKLWSKISKMRIFRGRERQDQPKSCGCARRSARSEPIHALRELQARQPSVVYRCRRTR